MDGDGSGDLLVGAFGAGAADGRIHAGRVYVLFGDSTLAGGRTVDLADSLPPDMTTILGAATDDRLGVWVSGGDVNGDGSTDLVLGADRDDGIGGTKPQVGKVVVLYGPIPRGVQIDLADPSWPRTTIWGVDTEDHFGATTACGDMDGDGRAEVMGAAASDHLSRNTYDTGGSGDGPPQLPARRRRDLDRVGGPRTSPTPWTWPILRPVCP